jgi:hypothetical protein
MQEYTVTTGQRTWPMEPRIVTRGIAQPSSALPKLGRARVAGRLAALPGGRVAALSERDMRILAFERSWWRLAGAKEREILEVFGMPVTRYYQLLNELIDRPEAAEFDPVLVARLRRQRSRRRRMRSARPD